jgi:hypothetical protein
MTYDYQDKKTAAVLSKKLQMPTAFNVPGRMAQAIGMHPSNQLMGCRSLNGKSGHSHKGIARYDFIILRENSSKIR